MLGNNTQQNNKNGSNSLGSKVEFTAIIQLKR